MITHFLSIYIIFGNTFDGIQGDLIWGFNLGIILGSLGVFFIIGFDENEQRLSYWSFMFTLQLVYFKWVNGTIFDWYLPTFFVLVFSNQNHIFDHFNFTE